MRDINSVILILLQMLVSIQKKNQAIKGMMMVLTT